MSTLYIFIIGIEAVAYLILKHDWWWFPVVNDNHMLLFDFARYIMYLMVTSFFFHHIYHFYPIPEKHIHFMNKYNFIYLDKVKNESTKCWQVCQLPKTSQKRNRWSALLNITFTLRTLCPRYHNFKSSWLPIFDFEVEKTHFKIIKKKFSSIRLYSDFI